MNKQMIVTRAALVALSLAATFAFLAGMGSGFTSILFALGGTLTQAAALLYLPGVMLQAWDNGRLSVATLSGASLAVVVLISVAGSASILSGLVDEQAQVAVQRAGLLAMASAKQESADRLIALDRITKAQPLLEEVATIRAQVNELPAPSGFYLAAQRLGGVNADTLITVVIVALSLLLDGVALLLGIDNRVEVVEVVKREPVEEYNSELKEVRAALDAGDLATPSVRNVRALLGCSQTKALEVARLLRAAEEQMPLF